MPWANRQLVKLIKDKTGGNVMRFAEAICMSQQRINRILVADKKTGNYPSVSEEVRTACTETFDLPINYFVAPPVTEELKPMDYLFEGTDKEVNNPHPRKTNVRKDESSQIDFSSVINAIIASKDETIAELRGRITDKDNMIVLLKSRISDLEQRLDKAERNVMQESYPFPLGVAEANLEKDSKRK